MEGVDGAQDWFRPMIPDEIAAKSDPGLQALLPENLR